MVNKILLTFLMSILILTSLSSAIQSNWTDAYSGTNFGAFGNEGGMLIMPTQTVIIDNVTVGQDTTFATLYIRNAPFYSGINIANSTNKSGNVFFFNPSVLVDVDYTWIIGSSDGNHEYGGLGNPTVPKTDKDITWEDGLNPTNSQTGQVDLVGGFDISSIGYHLPVISIFNLTSELLNPINNASVTVPVNLSANLSVSSSQLTNATLYIWNASDNSLVLTNLKIESIANGTTVETWTETLPINKAYIWNVQVCEIGGLCVFDEDNQTFNSISIPVPTPTPNPQHLITGSGVIFDSVNSVGSGFAIFLQILGAVLPFLLIGLAMVGVIVVVAWTIKRMIDNNIKQGGI